MRLSITAKLCAIFFVVIGITTGFNVSAAGTKKIGEACRDSNECQSNRCDDSYCTCGDTTPSDSCAATYGGTAADWKCINESEDPDSDRREWNFCKKSNFVSSLPKTSTDDVKYPVEHKLLMGQPCIDTDACLSGNGHAVDVCNETSIEGVPSPTTNPYYDPWYKSGEKLNICTPPGNLLAPDMCEYQYGSGDWGWAMGTGELTGVRVCQKAGSPPMSALTEMRKSVAQDTASGIQTSIFGITATVPEYKLTTPTPKIGIPGVVFTNITKESNITTDASGASWLNIPFLGEYISAVYKYSVGLISLIAVMVLIISGVQIITSAGNSEAISSAKHRITSAVIAIALTAGSYTILYTINPELVNLRNLKILVVPTKILDFKPEHDAILSSPDAPAQNAVVFPSSNKLLSPTLSSGSNPIPSLIGPLPSNLISCSKEAFDYTAKALTALNICVGPCHCAYTASHFLNYVGCSIKYSGSADGIKTNAIAAGWTKTTISNPNKTDKNLPIGLFWQDGHVGISLGSGKLFDSSGAYYKIVQAATGDSCPPPNPLNPANKNDKVGRATVFDIVPTDNTRNCNKCSLIPSEAPITGANASKAPDGPIKKYPDSLMKDLVHDGAKECESIQFWGIRSAPGGFTEIYTPPNAQ